MTKFKPSVAFESEREARANIEVKIEFLKSVVERTATNLAVFDITDEKLIELLKTLPDSKNKFNALSSDSLVEELRASAPPFRMNGASTLRRDKALTGRVETLLNAIVQAIENLSMPPKKVARVAGLSRQLKLSNTLREIAEATIYAQKRQIEKLRSEVASYKNKLESLRWASEQSAGTLRQEIKNLKGRATKEVDTSPKVVPLPAKPTRT
ncbi:hypothetical protein [Roseateles flavus]|uniref:Uncharacterized protein n=1 Tax=Roseateles flavus TaxID=3149041 RepID=A0ABV0G8E2_9BURK